ncbi:hypothetical protein F5051DRAFT_185023 [Lentinula edodes]|nr:hypothetical protein F5051DRAFT_185023 [Lentinula edodes]
MLPTRITTLPFFALLCLWMAYAPAVFASPLSATRDSKGAAPVPLPRQPSESVDLLTLIAHMNTLKEHLLVAVGDTILHANKSEVVGQEGTLVPRRYHIPLNIAKKKYHTEFIGKASFRNEQDKQKAVEEMLAVKMPPFIEEGTCLDYIRIVLEKLKVHGSINPSVLEQYETIYSERVEVRYSLMSEKYGIT